MSTALRTTSIAILMVLFAGPYAAQASAQRGTAADDPLEAMSWLAGHWVGDGLGGWNEELWSPPSGGSMMGVYRHIRDGRVVFYEFITLTMHGDTLVKAIKHFDPDMRGWEEPTESVRFPLLRVEPDAVYFDGVTYRRDGPDRMEITVMLGPDPDHLEPTVFTFRRVHP